MSSCSGWSIRTNEGPQSSLAGLKCIFKLRRQPPSCLNLLRTRSQCAYLVNVLFEMNTVPTSVNE